jgi:hypothetical protein
MEFWRTDEVAPVVLIILLELMVLGLIIRPRKPPGPRPVLAPASHQLFIICRARFRRSAESNISRAVTSAFAAPGSRLGH